MVKAVKGTLVTCDPAAREILLQLDDLEASHGGQRFVVQKLDETHILIASDGVESVLQQLQLELEKNNYVSLEL
ncbi:BZ3500_MvSof-1268-A1-R1_Chr1-1g01063 [Microbotryum saponariae]|uniref:General transcription and DNA repair factor IIH subunit TFB5 n=1 Tax=Microbotryum saponariae TaxID=289078 RepID=A0A2X0KCR4_9BASI|nr:BZ3500_MvSof-1268-A1-R1_Chr1-1g01063 [Microbotryum saponariae]SCZ93333.1 BZ3501_MvSof-1269-A2-R1_Chr1-1g00660 [Microbotryum saponariae]